MTRKKSKQRQKNTAKKTKTQTNRKNNQQKQNDSKDNSAGSSSPRKNWSLSNQLSLWKILVAITAILVTIIGLYVAYGIRFTVEHLPGKYDFQNIHVYSWARNKGEDPYIDKLCAWQRFRITNKSNQPITLVKVSSLIDGNSVTEIPQVFIKEITYKESQITLTNEMSLPFRLAPKECCDVSLLIPFEISKELGTALLPIMLRPDKITSSFVANVILGDDNFEKYENEIKSKFNETALSELIIIHENEITRIGPVIRNVLRKSGKSWRIIDNQNQAPDGFVFYDSDDLTLEVSEFIIKSQNPNLTFDALNPKSKTWLVQFHTSNGKVESVKLKAGENVLGVIK